MQVLKEVRTKPYGGTWAIEDSQVINCIDSFLQQNKFLNVVKNTSTQKFLEKYKHFIKKSNNNLHGIDNFQTLCFSPGTTGSFDAFLLRHRTRNIVSFAGEYSYANIWQRIFYGTTKLLFDSDQLQHNDALIISVPFADTGNEHEQLEKILQVCDQKDIPVLIDMAYINISEEIDINLNHACIEGVTSSLSKIFPIATLRIGIRMQKKDIDDGLDVYHEANYVNKTGIAIANNLLDNFQSDYIVKKYKHQQKNFCNKFGIIPSKTVILGIDNQNKFADYNRGAEYNRLCFAKHYDTSDL